MKCIEIDPNEDYFCIESWERFSNLFRPNYFYESTLVEVNSSEKINGKTFKNNQKIYWYDVPKLWDNDFENRIVIKFALRDFDNNPIAESIDEDSDAEEFIDFEIITTDKIRTKNYPPYESKVKFSLSGDYYSFIEDLIYLIREEDIGECDFEV